ncbi:MAG: NUDIX domain-containing protein [Treponema sp.]|nr:NUDIX domain-containing protein [Treponema sp.]
MKNNRFNFCPECGSKKIQTLMNGRKWLCPDCGFDLYNNVASAVGLLILNSRGEILMEKRAKEPRKGFLALPGGFTEPDETAEEAASRECEEEIGVRPLKVSYLCAFPNDYEYKSVQYKTCDVFFTAILPPEFELKPQEGEVESLVWIKVQDEADLEKYPIAFESGRKTLLKWLEEK